MIRNDSAIVSEKKLGQDSLVHFVSIDLNSPELDSAAKPGALPDYSVNDPYSSVIDQKLFFRLQDSSAIFTGVIPDGSNRLVYANSRGQLRSFNTKKNKLVWQKQYAGSIYGTPLATRNLIITGTIDGYISALNKNNGKEKWKLHTGEVFIADGIIEDDMLYLGGGSESFYKIDTRTGTIVWKNNSMSGQMQGKPVITDGEVVFGAWDRHLYCLDKNTGDLK